jgi:hypothetical protein
MTFIHSNALFAGITGVCGSASKAKAVTEEAITSIGSFEEVGDPRKAEIYVVAVDSRETTISDMASYKEVTCDANFFQVHVHDDPKNIWVKSPVAELCGLDIKLYFHDHSHLESGFVKHDHHRGALLGHSNGIATLLTFNPHTGKCSHLVRGKAYVLLDDGRRPLSKRQVRGLVDMTYKAEKLYEGVEEKQLKQPHVHRHGIAKGQPRDPSLSPELREAYLELLSWCTQYQEGTWAPHSSYEPQHAANDHHGSDRHKHDRTHKDNNHRQHDHHHRHKQASSGSFKKETCRCGSELRKQESGASDAATCNHGACHHHHDVLADRK